VGPLNGSPGKGSMQGLRAPVAASLVYPLSARRPLSRGYKNGHPPETPVPVKAPPGYDKLKMPLDTSAYHLIT